LVEEKIIDISATIYVGGRFAKRVDIHLFTL
jgi:hypothetical protein